MHDTVGWPALLTGPEQAAVALCCTSPRCSSAARRQPAPAPAPTGRPSAGGSLLSPRAGGQRRDGCIVLDPSSGGGLKPPARRCRSWQRSRSLSGCCSNQQDSLRRGSMLLPALLLPSVLWGLPAGTRDAIQVLQSRRHRRRAPHAGEARWVLDASPLTVSHSPAAGSLMLRHRRPPIQTKNLSDLMDAWMACTARRCPAAAAVGGSARRQGVGVQQGSGCAVGGLPLAPGGRGREPGRGLGTGQRTPAAAAPACR
jgi:hypothetical protein